MFEDVLEYKLVLFGSSRPEHEFPEPTKVALSGGFAANQRPMLGFNSEKLWDTVYTSLVILLSSALASSRSDLIFS